MTDCLSVPAFAPDSQTIATGQLQATLRLLGQVQHYAPHSCSIPREQLVEALIGCQDAAKGGLVGGGSCTGFRNGWGKSPCEAHM